MSAESDFSGQADVLNITAAPNPVDAGGALSVRALAAPGADLDLEGRALSILDQDETEIGSLVFGPEQNGFFETEPAELVAPKAAGDYTWIAILQTEDDEDDAPISAAFSFSVRAHKTTVLAWDVPSAIVKGEAFRFKVGLKCSSNCMCGGHSVSIRDAEGVERAKVVIGEDIVPGTDAMYFAEAEAVSADDEGLHKWEAVVEPADLGLPHAEASARFTTRVVAKPEFTIRVEVFDIDGKAPIAGAQVVVHPFRGVTDENGVVELMVQPGPHRILVSKAKHEATVIERDINGSTTERVRLAVEKEEDPDAHYY